MRRNRFNTARLLQIIVVLVLILSLFGCSAATTPTPAQKQEPTSEVKEATQPPSNNVGATTPVKLVMWASTDDSGVPECRYKVPVDDWNSANPDIQIELVARNPIGSEVRTVLAGGADVPDLVETTAPAEVATWAAGGLLLPLDNYAQQYGWQDRFLPWAYNLGKVNGKLHALPNEMETVVLYINKTVFDEHGWKAPKTFAEFEELGKQIKDAGLTPIADGGSADVLFVNEWLIGEYLNHVAGPDKVYQALIGEIPWTDPDFVLAAQKLAEEMKAGWIQKSFDNYKTLGWEDFHQSFVSGEAPMLVDGTWLLGDLTSTYFPDDPKQDKWEWVPFPSVSGEPIFDLGLGSTLSINKNSKHPDEAAKFLDYYYTQKAVSLLYTECSTAPAPIKLDVNSLKGVDPRTANVYGTLTEQTSKGNYGYTSWTFMTKEMSTVVNQTDVDLLLSGEITPEEWTVKLNDAYQAGVKDKIIPPVPPR